MCHERADYDAELHVLRVHVGCSSGSWALALVEIRDTERRAKA
jgi:hypothetical protein